MNAIEFNKVWKKFTKGEKINSLCELFPHLAKGILSWHNKEKQLQEKEFWALKGVSFELKMGETLGIIGPNGAGKSTILKLLSKVMNPNKGEIKVKGKLSALIEVTEGIHPELTGRENIYLNGTILGMTKKEIDRKFDGIVEFSGLQEFIDTPVKRYSAGMFSRLGFSVAAYMEPEILLVDEALAVGDIAFQAKCAQKMRELLSSNTTILLVSHDLSLVQSLCKRVILLNKGENIMEGDPEEVISHYQDMVYRQQEEEFKIEKFSDYKVRVNQETKVKIKGVCMLDGRSQQKERFKVGEPISIKIDYESDEKIENPIFSYEITRSDGVSCCASNTKKDGYLTESISGKGVIKINLGIINLAPSIYLANISIWDRDMVSPYTLSKKTIFRVESEGFDIHKNVIFLTKAKWEKG